MMNPPFSLKRGTDKEYKFVDQALAQLEDGGLLFTVLPYPAMCKPKAYDTWRKNEPCLSGYHPHPLYVVCTHFPE